MAKPLYGPKWEFVRSKVLKRDKYKCRLCRKKAKNLHVHHLCYFKGVKREDIKTKYLVTLCEPCHNLQHQILPLEHFYLTSEKDVTRKTFNLVTTKNKNLTKVERKRLKLLNSLTGEDRKLQERYDKHKNR